jgi:hypothetical protein
MGADELAARNRRPVADTQQMTPANQRMMEQMLRDQEEQEAADRAAEISRRSSMGTLKKAKGGMVNSASKRADGCAMRGKTRGKMV